MVRNIKSLKFLIDAQIASPPGEVSIIDLVDLLVEYAYSVRTSDIHIEPAPQSVKIRLRIDGILHDVFEFPKELHSEVISRIKVIASLKTDIHRLPQDGRFKAKIEGLGEVDVRVSVMPTYYGENVVMRILAEMTQTRSLKDLGFQPQDLKKLKRAVRKPYGMILANGPTGSGKTTTLYTIIKELNTRQVSIITIEDPIEYSIEGLTQIPVNNQAGLTFANGLRSILRQDPNIIMVGEIRDPETANISINAALTGHLLLSTLHTNDAATTFPRLVDMGAPPFLVASTVNIVISQRLVRKLCQTCKKERTLSQAELDNINEIAPGFLKETTKIFAAVGKECQECDGSGYRGRIAIQEVLEVNNEIRSLILRKANAAQIKELAVKQGMKTMVENGFQNVIQGITTLEEVLSIIYE